MRFRLFFVPPDATPWKIFAVSDADDYTLVEEFKNKGDATKALYYLNYGRNDVTGERDFTNFGK